MRFSFSFFFLVYVFIFYAGSKASGYYLCHCLSRSTCPFDLWLPSVFLETAGQIWIKFGVWVGTYRGSGCPKFQVYRCNINPAVGIFEPGTTSSSLL